MTSRPTLGQLVRAVADRVSPSPRRDLKGRRRRVTYLVVSAYATGGVPRAVFSVANELAERGHEVEVVSVYRTHPQPYMHVHPDVRVSHLEDRVDPDRPDQNLPRARRNPARSPSDRRLDRQPTELAEEAYPVFSALTDRLLRARLESLPPGIVVATRPELAVAAARWAPGT